GAVAFPRPARARFAAGVRQLHSGDAALVVNETNDTPQRLDMSVAPDAKILRTDAALRQDRGRFGHHQSRAADRATAEMDEMPVVSQTVAARVLTHRRDKDAVGELQIANRERIEQVSHTNTVDWHIALGEFGLTENSATQIPRWRRMCRQPGV